MLLSDMDPETAENLVKYYLMYLKDGTGEPYEYWSDYEQDTAELEHPNL
jgi:hypothetical protein